MAKDSKKERVEIGEELSNDINNLLEANIFSGREISEATNCPVSSIYRWAKKPTARTYIDIKVVIENFVKENIEKTYTQAEKDLLSNRDDLNLISEILNLTYEDEQNIILKFNQPMRYENAILQLEGIAFAVTFDDIIDKNELKMLLVWLKHNFEFVTAWPLNKINNIFLKAINLNAFTSELNDELLILLIQVGNKDKEVSEALKFDTIPEDFSFLNNNFVVTGTFSSIKRDEVIDKIFNAGGRIQNNVANNTDYLIVGEKGSKSWRFGNFGRKIESAISVREYSNNLKIISESSFLCC